jgi:hypothetical protein
MEDKNGHTEVTMAQIGIAMRGECAGSIQFDPERLSPVEDLEGDGRLLEAAFFTILLPEQYNALFGAMMARGRDLKARRAVQKNGCPVGVIYYPDGDVRVEAVQMAIRQAPDPGSSLRPASEYGNPDEGAGPQAKAA